MHLYDCNLLKDLDKYKCVTHQDAILLKNNIILACVRRLVSVNPEPRSHPKTKLIPIIFNYQTYFLKEYVLLNFFSDEVNNNLDTPKDCHQTKKCSNGKAQSLIGI